MGWAGAPSALYLLPVETQPLPLVSAKQLQWWREFPTWLYCLLAVRDGVHHLTSLGLISLSCQMSKGLWRPKRDALSKARAKELINTNSCTHNPQSLASELQGFAPRNLSFLVFLMGLVKLISESCEAKGKKCMKYCG